MYFYFYFFQISFHLLFHSFFFFYPSHSWQGPLDNYGCHENIIINSFLYRKKLLGHIRNPHIPCKHTHTHTQRSLEGCKGQTHIQRHTLRNKDMLPFFLKHHTEKQPVLNGCCYITSSACSELCTVQEPRSESATEVL